MTSFAAGCPDLETKFRRFDGDLALRDGAVISGHASLFGAEDHGGDVVQPGAWRRRATASRCSGSTTPRQHLRELWELIEEKKRCDWLFASIRHVAIWATAVAAGWITVRGMLSELIQGLQK